MSSRVRPVLALFALSGVLAAADWPQYLGPEGNLSVPEQPRLVTDLSQTTRLWESEVHLGPGKVRYNGNNAPMPSVGISSPVVSNGSVYAAYFWPSGPEPTAANVKRSGNCPLDDLVLADDVLVAIDAASGRTRWTWKGAEQGVNNPPDKRGGWGVTPAVADGRVFMLGSGGMLHAVSATDGKHLWTVPVEPLHGAIASEAKQLLEAGQSAARRQWGGLLVNLVVAGGTVVVPDNGGGTCGLVGFDPATGRERWRVAACCAGTATPAVWRDGDGHETLLVGTAQGVLRLIDPADGKVLWTQDGLGELTTPLLATRAGLLMLDLEPAAGKDAADTALYGCVAISRRGMERRWILPNEPRWRSGRGGDGRGYVRARPWGDDRFLHWRKEHDGGGLDIHAAADGRLLATLATGASLPGGWDAQFIPIGDRILGQWALGHWQCRCAWLRMVGDRLEPMGPIWTPPDGASAYETPMMQVPVDGRLYLRYYLGTYTKPGAYGGIRAYDLHAH